MCHRLAFHAEERCILILPDFIVAKYPGYMRLVELGIFEEVYLFPYTAILHRKETAAERADYFCRLILPYRLETFREIYVAGAHFYFTLCLIRRRIPFVFIEDAPGMRRRAGDLYQNLLKSWPVHAEIAEENGLFDGSCPLVKEICEGESLPFPGAKGRRKILEFFGPGRIRVPRGSVLFLTQQFAGLGLMKEEEQRRLAERLVCGLAKEYPVIVKRHPDDRVGYRFPSRVQVLDKAFPSELLGLVLKPCPRAVVAASSCGTLGTERGETLQFTFAEEFAEDYNMADEYTSMMRILDTLEREEISYAELFEREKETKM